MTAEQQFKVDDVFVAEHPERLQPKHRRVIAIYGAHVVYCSGGNVNHQCAIPTFRQWIKRHEAELRYRRACPIGLVQRLVDRLIERAMRTPYFHLRGYMERWWLLRLGSYSGHPLFGARIHHILRSDRDRGYHDHPWPYCTIILRGGYWELTPIYDRSGIYVGPRRTWRGAGSVLFRRARSQHRLELPERSTTWSLFITGPKVQEWGFMLQPEKTKIHWKQYPRVLEDKSS